MSRRDLTQDYSHPLRTSSSRPRPPGAIWLLLICLLLVVGCTRVVVAPVPTDETYDYTELPQALKARVVEGGPNPLPLTVNMTNAGSCDLDFDVECITVDGAAWLAVSPVSGLVPADVTGVPKSSTALTVTIDVISSSLTAGTYTGSIIITGECGSTGTEAVGSPTRISVNLTVTSLNASIAVDVSAITVDITYPSTWSPIRIEPSPRGGHSAVWTGQEMIVWGGSSTPDFIDAVNSGAEYEPLTDTWTYVGGIRNTPSPRLNHAAVWTGTQMIIYGGTLADGSPTETGSLYDPATRVWTYMSDTFAPSLSGHVAVWTGNEMLVCGTTAIPEGALYDPALDTWRPMSTVNAPETTDIVAVWTGREMIVWGGAPSPGGIYEPDSDLWYPLDGQGVVEPRSGHCAVWTGREMIVWGGREAGSAVETGACYDPYNDIWTPISTAGAPAARYDHEAIWTGSLMLVWGGHDDAWGDPGPGGAYDPASDTWVSMATIDEPDSRWDHTAVWTGIQMIVWGGYDLTATALDTGRLYE